MKYKLTVLLSWTMLIHGVSSLGWKIDGFSSKSTCETTGQMLKTTARDHAWNWANSYICIEVK